MMSVFKVWSFLMLAFGKLFGLLGVMTTILLSVSALFDFIQGGKNYADSVGTLILLLLFFALLFYFCVKLLTVKRVL